MPESRKERVVDIQASIGDINVSLEPATASIQVPESDQYGPGNHTIPAGAYKVEVHNTSLVDITVDGSTIAPNDRYQLENQVDLVNNRQDFCPAVNIIIPTGGSAYYLAYRPSA